MHLKSCLVYCSAFVSKELMVDVSVNTEVTGGLVGYFGVLVYFRKVLPDCRVWCDPFVIPSSDCRKILFSIVLVVRKLYCGLW